MQRLPLYRELPYLPVETAPPRNVDSTCRRCPLHKQAAAKTVCMAPEGEPGGLLVVGEAPDRTEDSLGRPFVGASAAQVRRLVQANWKGPVAWDNAVRCAPGRKEGKLAVTPAQVATCRNFLAATVAEVRPTRVLALGSWAMLALSGRAHQPIDVRRGYTWLVNEGAEPVPVFFCYPPGETARNPFVRRWFNEDIAWALTQEPPFKPAWHGTVHVVETERDARAAAQVLAEAEWVAWDCEWTGVQYREFRMLTVSLVAKGSVDAFTWDTRALEDEGARRVLADLLANPKTKKVGQNAKADQHACWLEFGRWVQGLHGDTRLWRHLIETEAGANLETMAELVGMGGHKQEAQDALVAACERVTAIKKELATGQRGLFGTGHGELPERVALDIRPEDNPKSFAYALVPREVRNRYNALDTVSTARLGEYLEAQIQRCPNLINIWDNVVHPAADAIAQVESWGMPVSRDAIRAFGDVLQLKLVDVHKRLKAYGRFDPASNPDLARFLFETLGLNPVKETEGGKPSTDAESLEALKGQHPVIEDLIEWRELSKQQSTYADGADRHSGMLVHVGADGRIHPSLNIDGARSGRISSSSPNLQNITRADSLLGKYARDCFATRPGWILVQLDYSQLELRVAAALSGDPAMCQVFLDGLDYHQRTAELISKLVWGIDPSAVTKVHRTAAKSFNFGIMYGMSDSGIARRAGCTVEEARRIRQAVFGTFKQLPLFIDACTKRSRQEGYAYTTWAGKDARQRNLFRIADAGDSPARGTAERSAFNTPVQGTASDFCLASVVELVRWIREEGLEQDVKLVVTVHDSVMLECRRSMVDEAVYVAREVMSRWPNNGVPLEVDAEFGPAWGSLKKLPSGARCSDIADNA